MSGTIIMTTLCEAGFPINKLDRCVECGAHLGQPCGRRNDVTGARAQRKEDNKILLGGHNYASDTPLKPGMYAVGVLKGYDEYGGKNGTKRA
jgi:hypothetical protein